MGKDLETRALHTAAGKSTLNTITYEFISLCNRKDNVCLSNLVKHCEIYIKNYYA